MAGQLWATSTQGQLLYSPLLSKEVLEAAQPDLKIRQFVTTKEAWGKNAGETFLIDKYGNIDTAGGKLSETSTIPAHSYRVYQATCTLYEYGNSIPFTRKYEDLSQVAVRAGVVTTLKNDLAKVIDSEIETHLDNCKIRYVGTATAGGAVTTDGTATATCASSLNKYHVKEIIDYMYQTMKAEPWDGDNYMAICSADAKRGIYDDVESMLQYTKFPATGEFGRYYDCRFVKTNHALSNAIGSGSAYGEAYFLGGPDAVFEAVAVTPIIIPKEVTDYQRSRGLAWYAIMGWVIAHSADPDNNVVKYDSA